MKLKHRDFIIKIGTVISIMYYVYLFYQPYIFFRDTGLGAAEKAWEFEDGSTKFDDYKMQRSVVGVYKCVLIIPSIILFFFWRRHGRNALSRIGLICGMHTLIALIIMIFLLWKALYYDALDYDALFARIWIFHFVAW